MPRIPNAARQLFDEIKSVVPDADLTASDPDGFGVYRTITIEGDSVDRILDAVSSDKRIRAVSGNVVEFVPTVNADLTSFFWAARAYALIKREDPEPTLEERLNSMTKAQIADEYGFESGTKKDMIAEILSDSN